MCEFEVVSRGLGADVRGKDMSCEFKYGKSRDEMYIHREMDALGSSDGLVMGRKIGGGRERRRGGDE